MNTCNPAKFGACIKNRTIQELSRRTKEACVPVGSFLETEQPIIHGLKELKSNVPFAKFELSLPSKHFRASKVLCVACEPRFWSRENCGKSKKGKGGGRAFLVLLIQRFEFFMRSEF